MSTKTTEVIFDGSSEGYLRLEEVANLLNINPDTLSTWARRYQSFPRVTLPGGSLRVRISEVEKWLKTFKRA